MTKKNLIENIKNYLLELDKIEFAYLYGSYAINKELPSSDVDIAIYQRFNKTPYKFRAVELEIEDTLSRLIPAYKFDIRSFNDAPIIVIGKILNEGKLLFFRNENFYYDYLVNMRLKYLDYSIVYNPLFNKRYKDLFK